MDCSDSVVIAKTLSRSLNSNRDAHSFSISNSKTPHTKVQRSFSHNSNQRI